MPDLRHLRAFVAVAEELNFTRAAARLHLAQQAVSKSVAQLEGELGVELLQRTSREVRLTDAGAALLDDARDVLAAADRAFLRAREHGRGLAGSLTIGATPAVGPRLLRELAAELREGAPELSIALRETRPSEVGALLREHRADVVLARTAARAPDVVITTLAPTPAELLVPSGHRLAAEDRPVALAELDGARLLVWSPPGTPYTDMLLGLCADAGASVTPVESSVTGGDQAVELVPRDAVAIVSEGSPVPDGAQRRAFAEPVTLPLVAVHEAGAPRPAVRRVLAALRGSDP